MDSLSFRERVGVRERARAQSFFLKRRAFLLNVQGTKQFQLQTMRRGPHPGPLPEGEGRRTRPFCDSLSSRKQQCFYKGIACLGTIAARAAPKTKPVEVVVLVLSKWHSFQAEAFD